MFPSNRVLLFLYFTGLDRALAWVMGGIVGLTLVRDSLAAEITAIENDLRDKNLDALFLTRCRGLSWFSMALSVGFGIALGGLSCLKQAAT